MLLRIGVGIQIFLMSVFAQVPTTEGIKAVGTKLDEAQKLFQSDGSGSAYNLIHYIIIFLGLIVMATGINDTFIAQDRGGENKKLHGVMKMVGGSMFIAISLIYDMFGK